VLDATRTGRVAAIPLSTSQFSCVGERSGNQDAMGYHLDEHFACFVVSDGVGGHAGGEVASRIAVDTALDEFVERPAIEPETIARYVDAANGAVLTRQRMSPDQGRMSATFAAVFVDRAASQVRWAHVGDSRVYWFRRGMAKARTEDHSLAERSKEALAAGADAGLVRSNLLYRALGARTAPETSVSELQSLADGDAFLLCTDGLWQLISTAVMERSLQLAASAEEWLALLRRAAEARAEEGQDNYSALAVWVGQPQLVTLGRG